MLKFHATGDWGGGAVRSRWVPETRRRVPAVEAMIERAWADALARPGVHLFDGAMCRLERWAAEAEGLSLELSPTSYKAFLGTNLSHPELAEQWGREVLANPVGVSPALVTADGWLMMGRRNDSVAYYPRRVHPFAGALDPEDVNVFDAVRRELNEELGLAAVEVTAVRCTGVAEDLSIRQPELIFSARVTATRGQIEDRMDATEHLGVWAARWEAGPIAEILAACDAGEGEAFTPVAVAAMALLGRAEFGREWFEQVTV